MQKTGIIQREVSGLVRQRLPPTTAGQTAAIFQRRRYRRQGSTGTRHNEVVLASVGRRQRTEGRAGEGNLCRSKQDTLDAAIGPKVMREPSVSRWGGHIGRHQMVEDLV
ncbi:hypothetical protein DPMN_078865 [Dreissena polymorpha]|uniref:Uncharacterized protein n=1 Tax=Dreissena polymorpha TaxID=45954 RepID=A0A9D4BQM5_DREPO|nr:hypothetical protein DPMN_078865 [Dreissena polymorpha]